jgi:nucleoside-diphosphate-sugar epimerase
MKRAIIIGARGLIGRGLVNELIKKKIPILILGTSKNIEKYCYKFVNKDIKYYILKYQKISNKNYINNIKKKFLTDNSVFFNLAWKGIKNLNVGVAGDQIKNVNYSCQLIKLAKDLGAKKYIATGSLEELMLKRYVNTKSWLSLKKVTKPSWYALSKVSSWMQSAFEAYQRKIDFCYVRISVVIDVNLNTKKFVEISLKSLLKEPKKIYSKNNELCNISSSDEIGRQLIAVGKKGINGRDYILGTGRSASLRDYFHKFLKIAHPYTKITKKKFKTKNLRLLNKKDFNIKNLISDTGYKPKENPKNLFKKLIN